MNEHIERIIDEGFSAMLLVLAMTVFFITNNTVDYYMSSTYKTNRLYIESNDYATYDDTITGGDVITTILWDEEGMLYTIKNSGGDVITSIYNQTNTSLWGEDSSSFTAEDDVGSVTITTSESDVISSLDSIIDIDKYYLVEYDILDGEIEEIIFTEQ